MTTYKLEHVVALINTARDNDLRSNTSLRKLVEQYDTLANTVDSILTDGTPTTSFEKETHRVLSKFINTDIDDVRTVCNHLTAKVTVECLHKRCKTLGMLNYLHIPQHLEKSEVFQIISLETSQNVKILLFTMLETYIYIEEVGFVNKVKAKAIARTKLIAITRTKLRAKTKFRAKVIAEVRTELEAEYEAEYDRVIAVRRKAEAEAEEKRWIRNILIIAGLIVFLKLWNS